MANSKTEVGKTQDEPETLSGTRKKGSAQKIKKEKKMKHVKWLQEQT